MTACITMMFSAKIFRRGFVSEYRHETFAARQRVRARVFGFESSCALPIKRIRVTSGLKPFEPKFGNACN